MTWAHDLSKEVLYGKTFSFQVFPFVTLYLSFAFLFTLSYFSWQLWCQLGWQVKVSNSLSLCSDEASYRCNILRWWCDLEQISVHSQMQIYRMVLFVSLLKSFILKVLFFFAHFCVKLHYEVLLSAYPSVPEFWQVSYDGIGLFFLLLLSEVFWLNILSWTLFMIRIYFTAAVWPCMYTYQSNWSIISKCKRNLMGGKEEICHVTA